MRIAADRKHPRLQEALLHQHDVADALHVEELFNTELGRKLTRELEYGSRLRVHGRHEVIAHQYDLVRIPDPDAQLFQPRPDPARPARIEQQRQVDIAGNDLAGAHGLLAGGTGNNFLHKSCGHRRSLTEANG